MNQAALRQEILSHIHFPRIPSVTVNGAERGILPDTGENLRKPLQNAIDALSAQGGGCLALPAGVYRTGALRLKSGVELCLESPQTLLQFVSDDLEANYPLELSHWEASPCWNFSALLYARGEHDMAVTGPGVLDGGAGQEHWWNWHHQVEQSWSADKPDFQQRDRMELRRMNMDGVPVRERRFGPGHYLRPNFVQFLRCERVLLSGFTLCRSPMWQINPVYCRGVIVDGVTMRSHGPNNDGCDPESCDGVWIKNCVFDTGDDCISLKSGRDRDGREANAPCAHILIEDNHFADGHGGIALGSEMSGGIHSVLACGNRFSSPNLTYALRLKTNARRGGFVERVMLCDSVMERVHGAAVHGTMLYEDGRNGGYLPVFRDITVENITARGGDYGIFLEAFPEVPITGLTLRNIRIDGVRRELRGMNWKDAVVENVEINGKRFPRPGSVRILGVPFPGGVVRAAAEGGLGSLSFHWEVSPDAERRRSAGKVSPDAEKRQSAGEVSSDAERRRSAGETSPDAESWQSAGTGSSFTVPPGAARVRLTACDAAGSQETSAVYHVLPVSCSGAAARLACRGMLPPSLPPDDTPVTRGQLAGMLLPLADRSLPVPAPTDTDMPSAALAAANAFFPLDAEGRFFPDKTVTRQEMATVAMEACGVSYRNASSTTPVCADADRVANNYAANAARALYFGFLTLENGNFYPERAVTVGEAVEILDRVADFAGR